jgi:dihydrofolate reductase
MAPRAAPAVAVIAAVARNGVIGAGNALPWRLPQDLAHFRRLTTGHTVVMGRRTWQSLPRALPDRQNIVVTGDAAFAADGAHVVHDFTQALAMARLPAPVFCIGGAALYAAAIPLATTMHLTEIDRDFDGDVRFPGFDRRDWRVEAREEHASGNGMRYAFVTYARCQVR